MTERPPDEKAIQVVNLSSGDSSDLSGLVGRGSGEWKFVVVDTRDARHLVFGPVSKFKYHAGLVRRFCDLRDIACLTVKKPDLVQVLDQAVHVRGGGRVRYDERTGALHFYDSSRAYGSFSRSDLSQIIGQSRLFDALSIHLNPS